MASLTLYGSNVAAATLTSAGAMSAVTGGAETSAVSTYTSTHSDGEVHARTGSVADVTAIPATPTGFGWAYVPGAGTFATGNWSAVANLATSTLGTSPTWTMRFFKYTGTYTLIGSITGIVVTSTAKTSYTFTATSMSTVTFAATDILYVDLWKLNGASLSGATVTVYESNSSSAGFAGDMVVTTSTFTPVLALPTTTMAGVGTLNGALVTPGELVLYGSSVADGTLTTASDMALNTTGGTETAKQTSMTGSAVWGEITSQGSSVTAVASIPATPTGKGWVYTPGIGTFATGNWSAAVPLASVSWGGAANTAIVLRLSTYSGGVFTVIGSWAAIGITGIARTTYLFPPTAFSTFSTGATDELHFDLWWNDTNTVVGGDNPTVYVSSSATAGVSLDMQVITSAFTPGITATLAGVGTLAGTTTLATSLSNALAGVGTLAGTTTLATVLTSTLAGAGQLSGTLSTTGGVSLSVTLAGAGLLTGTLGRQLYVATTGNDSTGNGSQSTPWATLGHAATLVNPGDTVHVASGTYTESHSSSTSIFTQTSGTSGSPITWISDVKWGAKITSTGCIHVWSNSGDYSIIQGFDISSADASGAGINNISSYTQEIGNYIHDIPTSGSDGIFHGGYSNTPAAVGSSAIGNLVVRIGATTEDHCIYNGQAYGVVQNNIVGHATGDGIMLWHASTQCIVANNLTFNNGRNGMTIGSGDAAATINDYTVVSNNICLNNSNVFQGIGIHEISATPGAIGTHNQYLNNCMFGNLTDFSLQSGVTPTGTVSVNPLLVSYAGDGTGNYHLTSTSPCIDAGTTTDAPTTDYDGNVRPFNGLYDIGPYEYTTVALSVTFGGVGSLSGTASLSTVLTATLAGVGTLSGAFSLKTALTTTIAGVGTLAGTLSGGGALSVTMAGVGTLASTFSLATALTDTMPGVGTLTSSLSANLALPATTLVGAGTLSGTVQLTTALTSTMAGVGTLVGTTSLATALASTLAGVGTLAGTFSLKTLLSTTLAGVGTLTGTLSGGGALACTFAGVGTLTGTTSLATSLTTTFVGIGIVNPALSASLSLPATTLAGIGTLIGTTQLSTALSTTMVGAGTLSGTTSLTTTLTTTLVGTGTLAGTLSLSTALTTTMAGVGQLSATITEKTALTTSLVGAGTLAGAVVLSTALTTTLIGMGTLTGVFSLRVALSLTFAGMGTLSGTLTIPVTAYLSATCVTRDMQAIAKTRDMQAIATTRDMQATAKTRR